MTTKLIAIIDDEPRTVEMIATFLKLKGYETRSALLGHEGLTLVQTVKPDALLLDLMLPDIEGYDVCQRLRTMPEFATLPILIVSARTEQASIDRATAAGADAYFTKPVKFPELIATLDELISARASTPPSAPESRSAPDDTHPTRPS